MSHGEIARAFVVKHVRRETSTRPLSHITCIAERHPAGVRRAARIFSIRHPRLRRALVAGRAGGEGGRSGGSEVRRASFRTIHAGGTTLLRRQFLRRAFATGFYLSTLARTLASFRSPPSPPRRGGCCGSSWRRRSRRNTRIEDRSRRTSPSCRNCCERRQNRFIVTAHAKNYGIGPNGAEKPLGDVRVPRYFFTIRRPGPV
jgi:hypothetical protein